MYFALYRQDYETPAFGISLAALMRIVFIMSIHIVDRIQRRACLTVRLPCSLGY